MRLAHIESSMDWGGQELRIVEQTAWLNAHGHTCWIVARPGAAILAQARARDLPVLEMEIRGSMNPTTLRSLRRFIRQECIDLIDCHGNRDSTYGAYLKWFYGMPVVRSRHVTDPIGASGLKKLVWRHGNHGVIVTAGRIREMLQQDGLADPDDVYVAVAGVDEQRFNPALDGSALRERLGIPLDAKVIANVGMIRPDKGQLFFVRACQEMIAERDEVFAIHLGEATGQTQVYKQQVLAEAASEIDSGRIRFLGYQSDIENWLALADIVVVASIGTEAQTRLVAQAFLMKKNIVATTVGGLPEMIRHDETGLLCAPGDAGALRQAVTRLLDDAGLAEALRDAAYRHALAHMSFDYMMQGMLACYRQALQRAGKRQAAAT
ncbi:glycosyltransferase family 4 protein [Paludibacterium purpuratum]|uniref:Glycosyltransferase involved in cell wall biosynthesis n=1 Tax=Paludibacterium purpuratum TaxID=1144873 RepID=A0A4R7B7R4_9NEIS|nr:glycosyltransferase family 4 protein [Paludibacterium purpuratum]TDR80768.1 glycosyltransferase involved in cell wall biosynthesis [Paludibacterium purpuratum]